MRARRFVAVLAILGVLGMPAGGSAAVGQRSRDIAREQALQKQEQGAAFTLLSLDERLAADKRTADRIEAVLPAADAAAAAATRAWSAAAGRMATDRRDLGLWLNFFYRYGDVSLLSVLLGAGSFNDFISRLILVTTLIENQAALWHRAAGQEAILAQAAADRKNKEEILVREKTELDRTMTALAGQDRDKAAFLASLRRQSAALAQQVTAEEAAWVTALQPLTQVLGDLSTLPWEGMTPESVKVGPGRATLVFAPAAFAQVLDSDPGAAGVNFQVAADASGVVISGESGVDFALKARLAVAGPRTVRLVPTELDLAGLPAQEATLQAVCGGDLSFDLPPLDPQWKLSAISTGPDQINLEFVQ